MFTVCISLGVKTLATLTLPYLWEGGTHVMRKEPDLIRESILFMSFKDLIYIINIIFGLHIWTLLL